MLNLLKRFAAVVCLLSIGVSVAFADNYVKREVRSVWMTTVWALDWPSVAGTSASTQKKQKEEMISYLDRLEKDNFNTIYFQVRSMSDAMYRSSYEPWSSYLTGSRGADPGWDPLEFVVEECHKRGIECHAWVNPYRWSTGTDWSTSQDQALKDAGWLLSYGNTTILNPGIPAARQRIVDVCREITKNYDVDGIVFDDYFYPSGIPTSSSADDYNLWKQSGTSMSFGDWRRYNVNRMVEDVYNMIQEEKPYVKFGISPAGAACTSSSVAAGHGVEPCPVGSDWQYDKIFSDPVAWLKEGTIDYISPQLYWKTSHSSNPFGPLTDWWSYVAKKFNRHHYASHSISFLNESNTESDWKEIGKQLQYSRDYTENAAPGEVYYSAAYITGKKKSGLGEWLLENKYQRPAIAPAIDWKKADNHGRVESLSKDGLSLTWNAVEGMRYSVYAIPMNLKYEQVQSTVTDGIMSDYLLDITYANSYTLPETYTSGYYFAVCILDRYGNEFAPRYTNESTVPADKVTLLSPADGGGVKISAEFKWSAVTDGTYELNVATDSEFKSLLVREYGLTENSYTLDVVDLDRGATYYWRVITSQPDRYDVASDVASFTTLPYDPAGEATLVAPADGTEITDLAEIDFSWNAVDGCSYTLQVADNAQMDPIVYSKKTGEDTSITVPIMSVGFSKTLYWRVATDRYGYTTSYSPVWSFTTPTVPKAPETELYAPSAGETVKTNFLVEFKRVDADKYTMQVASTPDFSEIVREVSPGWEIDGDVVRGAVSISFIPAGSYYWRIAVAKTGCEDSFSESRAITVSNSIDDDPSEEDYTMIQDKAVYSEVDGLQVSNLWVRSVKPEYGNLAFGQNGTLNRSFCVTGNVIYVSGREENSAEAACYLDKYNALTGAKIGRIQLPSEVQGSYFPCNDVLKDNATGIAVANLTLNIATTPLRVYEVDKETGEVRLAAECKSTNVSSGRVDHCSLIGSLASGNFSVFAAVGSGDKLLEWVFRNSEQTAERVYTVDKFYPKSSDFGIAPRVFPYETDDVFFNGGAIAPMRFDLNTGAVSDSFESNTSMLPEGLLGNGFTAFTFNKENFMAYPSGDHTSADGYRFDIVKADSDNSFASMQPLWTVPQAGLGSVNSTTADALVDYEIIRSGRVDRAVNVYLYVPGNGMAGYSIFSRPASGIADTEVDGGFSLRYVSGEIVAGRTADRIEVYDISGALLATKADTDRLRFDATRGIYVVRAIASGEVAVSKIAVK